MINATISKTQAFFRVLKKSALHQGSLGQLGNILSPLLYWWLQYSLLFSAQNIQKLSERLPGLPAKNNKARIILIMKQIAIKITRYFIDFLQEAAKLNTIPTISKIMMIESMAMDPIEIYFRPISPIRQSCPLCIYFIPVSSLCGEGNQTDDRHKNYKNDFYGFKNWCFRFLFHFLGCFKRNFII